MNLIEGLQKEMNRCREVLKEYESIPQGAFGAFHIKESIRKAEWAIASGDVIEMMAVYRDLKEIK